MQCFVCFHDFDSWQVYILCYSLVSPAASAPATPSGAATASAIPASLASSSQAPAAAGPKSATGFSVPHASAVLTSDDESEEENSGVQSHGVGQNVFSSAASAAAAQARAAALSIRPPLGFSAESFSHHTGGIILPVSACLCAHVFFFF